MIESANYAPKLWGVKTPPSWAKSSDNLEPQYMNTPNASGARSSTSPNHNGGQLAKLSGGRKGQRNERALGGSRI
jgi:hypothetical protein